MKIQIPYGDTYQEAELPAGSDVQIVDPPAEPIAETEEKMIEEAMENPIASPKLEELVRPDEKVCIIVNDHTRPGPNALMAGTVVKHLEKAGVPDANIYFVIATGSHRPTTDAELDTILGKELHSRIRCYVHHCKEKSELTFLGNDAETGMPIWINSRVVEADFIVTTGVIVPHHSAGFSGGRKSILPGVSGLETLRIHHSLPIRPAEPAMGKINGNPFHEVALRVAKKVGVRFIVNAVQDLHKQTVEFVAGDLEKAHYEGVEKSREANTVEFDSLGDIVIAGPGGSPRDRNLYQAQKALSVEEILVKHGTGVMILCARAEEGVGEGLFYQWMAEAKTPEEVIERYRREGFNVGNNKAFMVARALTKGRVIIVSENLSDETLHEMMLEHATTLQEAVNMAMDGMRQNPKIIVLPRAVNIIPHITAK